MSKCGEVFQKDSDLEFHQLYEHLETSQWNCLECSFQAKNRDDLKNHMNFKHTKEKDKEVYNCEVCKRQFRSLWHLRNHSRDEHGSKEECSFYNENRCKFGSKCWKKHSPSQGNKSFTCFTCKETFQSMNTLMYHRKKEHEELCRPCEPKNGSCRYEDNPQSCWFIHQDFLQVVNRTVPP